MWTEQTLKTLKDTTTQLLREQRKVDRTHLSYVSKTQREGFRRSQTTYNAKIALAVEQRDATQQALLQLIKSMLNEEPE